MSLKQKILLEFGVAVVLMALAVLWAVVNLVSLGRASDAILRENYRSILAIENMVNALERQDSGILLMLLGRPHDGQAQFRANEGFFLEWLGRAKDNVTIEGEAELVQKIEVDYAAYRDLLPVLMGQAGGAETPFSDRSRFYTAEVEGAFARVHADCVALRSLNESTMYAASVRAGRVSARAIWSTLTVAGCALALALGFSLLVTDRIVQPLGRCVDAARRISAGDYAVKVPVETSDELGVLAREFNRMVERLAAYRQMNIEEIIAEKTKSEAILSSIADGLIVFDKEMRITGINPAARQILNLELQDCTMLTCADLPLLEPAGDLIRKTLEGGAKADIPDEERIIAVTVAEQPRHYLFSVTGIRGRDRQVGGVVMLLRDVTRLKEVERIKSDFVMAASHELRTPLTSLGMSLDLLMEQVAPDLSDRNRQLLQAAHEEVARLKALVSDLLDLSKIEAGRIVLDFEQVPVLTLFTHVQEVFRGQADMKGVTIATSIPESLPLVRADANKVTWVLTNLVSNALRYSSEKGTILVAAVAAGQFVDISVHDEGPGIPEEQHGRLFKKFVQVGGRRADGSGLGLAICKEIVRAHGGTIWVESSPGRGSTFTFSLPVAE